MDHVDVVGWDSGDLRDDLRKGRLVSLTLRLDRDPYHGLARRVDPQLSTVGHPEAEDVHVLARASANTFGEEAEADPHQLAPLALLGLFAA